MQRTPMAEHDHPLTPTLSPAERGTSSRQRAGEEEESRARVCLGAIAGAHGVRGLVRVKSFTAEPQAIATYGPLQDEEGQRRFSLDVLGESKGLLIARISGIEDRDAAERLKGVRLYVRRADLPEPDAEEFYQADLIGLVALRADGTSLGTVRAVNDFGAGASLEIEDDAGKTVIVPFTAAAVPTVDIAGGRLVVEPPVELLAPAAAADEA
jgi:16S rRNA processing protein RimM